MTKAIGIYGGTFDPIHLGHLITAQFVLELRNLEKIIFIPCNISPFKQNENHADSMHRLEMTRIAIKNYPQFDYSDFEIKKGAISYTIETLRHLSKTYPKLELIIGFDNLVLFDKWKEPDEIIKLSTLTVLKRRVENKLANNKYFSLAKFVETPIIEISSSMIRRRIKNNQPVDFLIPPEVLKYIKTNGLYK